jgi:AraC-like DNA-binding protein
VKLREEEEYHNTYSFERMVFSKIQKGDVEFFRSGMRSSAYKVGKMADTSLRQEKNTFIVSVALATRSAVAGGLDEEIAYQLSDEYIQTVESMVTLDSIDLIQRTMLIDFAERVRDASLPLQDIPEDIARSIKYIRLHTNSNLSVQEVADAVGLSRSHLSHKFKEAMGFDISAFMMRCKLEEAKSLLMYSEQSISEISNYLCFSSQSYFTSVFRQKYGLTPKEYRMQFGKEFNL